MAERVGVVSIIVGKPKRFASRLTLFLRCAASAGLLLRLGQAIAVRHARVLCLRWACCLRLRIVTGQCVEICGNPCQDALYACLIELDILGGIL